MMKKLFAVCMFAAMVLAVSAQETADDGKDYKPFPHMFVGVQGGGQTTLTNYNNFKIATPTVSTSVAGSRRSWERVSTSMASGIRAAMTRGPTSSTTISTSPRMSTFC